MWSSCIDLGGLLLFPTKLVPGEKSQYVQWKIFRDENWMKLPLLVVGWLLNVVIMIMIYKRYYLFLRDQRVNWTLDRSNNLLLLPHSKYCRICSTRHSGWRGWRRRLATRRATCPPCEAGWSSCTRTTRSRRSDCAGPRWSWRPPVLRLMPQ